MNRLLGILIVILYFLNAKICYWIFPDNVDKWWDLKVSLLAINVALTINYKPEKHFIEKLFIAIIINNIYVLLFKSEFSYEISDITFIFTFTIIQYVASSIRKYMHNNSGDDTHNNSMEKLQK
jgi:hypothetical protein